MSSSVSTVLEALVFAVFFQFDSDMKFGYNIVPTSVHERSAETELWPYASEVHIKIHSNNC